jgi:S-adenosylmethionine hydrolase
MVEIETAPVHRRDEVIEGQVIHVDAFGNLITTLSAEVLALDPGADVGVEVEGIEGSFQPSFGRTFSDVESGALIAYIGSGGQLEIARRDGSAAVRIGADRGAVVRVRSS